jgi:D-alanyl-D-alanine carboxypeptidase (penicillin-binding protein 5/6)
VRPLALQRRPEAGRLSACAKAIRAAALFSLATAVLPAALLLGFASQASASAGLPTKTITAELPPSAQIPPTITAKAAILVNADSGAVLFSQDADEQLPMASTTKIMTAAVVLESLDLDEKITVPLNATGAAGSVAGLEWGEVLTVEQLLYCLLIPSGNDAAVTLAEAAAGSVPAFVERMNAKADALGLTNTHFVNPNGLHGEDHYSSARDLAVLAQYALQDPVFRRIVDTPTYDLPRPGEDTVREFKNGNALLSKYDWVNGVKTGSTPYAEYCMVASGSIEGVSLISVLLGAADDDVRWKETEALLDYGFHLYPRTVLATRGELFGEAELSDPLDREVPLVAENALVVRLSEGDVVVGAPRLLGDTAPPVQVGDVLGVCEFTLEGTILGSVRLVAARAVEGASLGEIVFYWRYWRLPGLTPGF